MSQHSSDEVRVSEFLKQVQAGHPPWYMLNSAVSKTCYKAFQSKKPWQELGTDPLNLDPLSFGAGNVGTGLKYADESQAQREASHDGKVRLVDSNGAEFDYRLAQRLYVTEMTIDKTLKPDEGVDERYARHRQTYSHRLERDTGGIWEELFREEQNNSAGWAVDAKGNTTFCTGSVIEDNPHLSRLRAAGLTQNGNSLVFIIGQNYDWVFRHCRLADGLCATAVRSHSGTLIWKQQLQMNTNTASIAEGAQAYVNVDEFSDPPAIKEEYNHFSASIEDEQAAMLKSDFFLDAGDGPRARPTGHSDGPLVPVFMKDWGMPEGLRRTFDSEFVFDLYHRSDTNNIFLPPSAGTSSASQD